MSTFAALVVWWPVMALLCAVALYAFRRDLYAHEHLRNFATVVAAIAACSALWFNYRAMVGAQRSWVLFDTKGDSTFNAETRTAALVVRNFGHTPARGVQVHQVLAEDEGDPARHGTSVLGVLTWLLWERSKSLVIPPGRSAVFTISADSLKKLVGSPWFLLLDISYWDQFGEHSSRVCVVLGTDRKLTECPVGTFVE